MEPFRWPSTSNDLMLATEAAGRRPKTAADWEEIAQRLSIEFSTENRVVKLTGRACRERLDRLITKYAEDDKKALKKFHEHVERLAKIHNPGYLRLKTPNRKLQFAVCGLQ